ncbi:MAG: hypothetical protein AAF183_11315 [Pseudomonadota bacterium]
MEQPSDRETKEVWAVVRNTDDVEGRGRAYIAHFCELPATAYRLAKGKGVQGGPADVDRIILEKRGRHWLGPVEVELPTSDDKQAQKRRDDRDAALRRAQQLGLTKDEIEAIRRN